MKWSELALRVKIIIGLLFVVGALAGASAIYNWFADKPVTSQSEYIATPEIKKAKKIEHKKIIVTSRIDVLDKKEAVDKLKINDPVKSDASKQITATAEIQPYDGKTSVISVLNTSTGISDIIAKQEPLSFFGFENRKEFGVRVGYSTDEFEMRSAVYGRWQFLRVGSFHMGVYGEANSRGEGIGQLEISYKF